MAIRSVLDDTEREDLRDRLRRLRPDAGAAWGTLDAPRMLCHVADQMRVALGDAPSRPVHTFVTRTLVKSLVVNTPLKPPRAKIRTAPEMLTSKPTSWDADLAACLELVERVGRGLANAVHPTFGPLSPAEWGRLCWKHLDHHLRQFRA
ncbi:MAG TPA: DUF1569 domain-containing protein [Candidatus Krumholzibacteria bacterium]|nr:DUF1569 domain-containing protein [Candidatus Krumholzibacteria bacterium]HPD72382.1 DUF1569 domain-containing protein [Candidatus Krumholzibacteria bacterium]HRY40686.1 DUF1569 domain-containing protein [Candidatus Krumholzibacteria bacterium]